MPKPSEREKFQAQVSEYAEKPQWSLETASCPLCRQDAFVMYHIPGAYWVGIATHFTNEGPCPQREAPHA